MPSISLISVVSNDWYAPTLPSALLVPFLLPPPSSQRSTFAKEGVVTPPAASLAVGGTSDLVVELRQDSFTVQSLNHTKANTPYSFSRPLRQASVLPLCSHLGDITIRLQKESETSPSSWSTYGSNALGKADVLPATAPVLAAQDISNLLAGSAGPTDMKFPLKVVRSYESSKDGKALVMRFKFTNAGSDAVRIGGLGFAMPEAPGDPPKGIETTVWNDPSIGGDHGFVEFVRVVDDERTMLVVAEDGFESKTTFEAWRPVLEDLGGGDVWEWAVHSAAWADEWKVGAQFPFMNMSASTHGKPDMFPNAKTPWPSCDGHEGVPVSDEASFPWNAPTSAVLKAGESVEHAFRLQLASDGQQQPPFQSTSCFFGGLCFFCVLVSVIYIYIYFKWGEKGKPLEYTEGCFPSHGRGGRMTPHQRPLTSISIKLPLLMYADVRHSGDSPHPFRPAITERSLRVDGAAGGARHSWLRDPGRHDYRTTVGEATKRRKSQRSYCGNLWRWRRQHQYWRHVEARRRLHCDCSVCIWTRACPCDRLF